MKQDYNLLDDFLREKVDEAKFTFREEYWEKMTLLLDKEEKKKRFPLFWRGLSILLITLAIGASTYLYSKLHSNTSKLSKQHTNSNSIDSNNGKASMNNVDAETKDVSEQQNSSPDKVNHQSSEPSIHQRQNMASLFPSKERFSDENIDKENQAMKPVPPSVEPIMQTKNDEALSVNAKRSITKDESQIEDATFAETKNKITKGAKNAIANVDDMTTKSPKNKSTKSSLKNTPAISDDQIQKNKVHSTQPLSEHKNVALSSQEASLMSVKGTMMKAIDTNYYSSVSKRDETIYNPRYISSLVNYIPERLAQVTEITLQPVGEKVADMEPSATNDFKMLKKEKQYYPWALIVLAGINANKGFKSELTGQTSWGFSPYIGLGAERQVSPRLTMAAHVGFTYLNGLNSNYRVTQYAYGFGLDSSVISISYKSLLQFYLPFTTYYQLANKHFIMGSLGLSYSSDVYSTVEETSMSNNIGFSTTTAKQTVTTSKSQYGYRTGFNQFDLFAQLGYSYQVLNNLMIQATVQQGFFDITKNDYFKNTISNTQTRISLGLKYSFKRR